MKRIALAAILLFLFAGCSTARLTVPYAESRMPAVTPETASSFQPESEPTEKFPSPSDASSLPPSPASSEPAVSAPSESEESPLEEVNEHNGQSEPYDAAQAVHIEPMDSGIQVTFEQLPQTASDLESLMSVYPQSDARNTGAFLIASLVRYVDSPDDGMAMIDLLRGPRPMNDMDKSFLKDRLREKNYLPRSYFEGASPENDYTPDTPWTLMVFDDSMEAEEGYLYIQVATTGADSKRRITLREKDGQYYLWSYSNVLTGIRLPASLDPWL